MGIEEMLRVLRPGGYNRIDIEIEDRNNKVKCFSKEDVNAVCQKRLYKFLIYLLC